MRYESLWDRLVAQIRIEGCCWTWVGAVRHHAGGNRPAVSMRVKDVQHPRQFNACRLMCVIIHGEPPTPQHEASHLCDDNWLCLCPDHLLWETKRENLARRDAKRRGEMLEPDFDTRGEITVECPF